MSDQRDELKKRFADLAKYGAKFEKALDAALTSSVKEARFLPSGRKVLSVVGKLGDEFVDLEKPYCSCGNFYFKVTRGNDKYCYHLLGLKIASASGLVEIIEFDDEEYPAYLTAIVADTFEVLGRS
ncbi:MAG: SWIM zinc finger family protein [archaeon]|nr:MAG: SWIM zinc finger family protein [archaeon]